MKDCMIDFETLALGPDAVVVQLGVAFFDIEDLTSNMDTCNYHFDITKQPKRICDTSTIKFWLSQADTLRDRVFYGPENCDDLSFAISEVLHLAHQQKCKRLWSHGSTFDIPIFNHLCNTLWLDTNPETALFHFSTWRDTRTLWDLAETISSMPHKNWISWTPLQGHKHDALADAKFQAIKCKIAYALLSGISLSVINDYSQIFQFRG